ncbi:hypothetical protein K438DRAFT_1970302 [Mycena galopus ATCC 62051]|nr:hypothetical protein K438DRAFT_1970302 [Mycena galopus ATCC 62051]
MSTKRTNSGALDDMENGMPYRTTSPSLESGPGIPPKTTSPSSSETRFKVTVWRLVNTAGIMGFGIYKSGNTTLTSSDWWIFAVWGTIAYWATLVEFEAPTLAPWLFTRDYSRLTRFVLAECVTVLSIAFTPFLSLFWALDAHGKPADRQVSIYMWVVYIAFAPFAPFKLWDHINDSRVIKWIRARSFPQQVDEQPTAGAWDLKAVFQWTKWVAALLNTVQIGFNIYSFTRGSGPAPTPTFLWLVTIGVSVGMPVVVCITYLAVRGCC